MIENLYTNYSDYQLTEYQKKYLNLGLNFCPRRDKLNKTGVIAALMRWERVMRWVEFWYRKKNEQSLDVIMEEDEEEEDEDINNNNNYEDRVFKDKEIKTNLPRKHNMRGALKDCIAGTKTGILGADLNDSQPNVAPAVIAAGEDLANLQKDRVLDIKPINKTGGTCILPFDACKQAMDAKMKETFVGRDGKVKPKYVEATKKDLQLQHARIKTLV